MTEKQKQRYCLELHSRDHNYFLQVTGHDVCPHLNGVRVITHFELTTKRVGASVADESYNQLSMPAQAFGTFIHMLIHGADEAITPWRSSGQIDSNCISEVPG